MSNLIVETNKKLALENENLKTQLDNANVNNLKLNNQVKRYKDSLIGRGRLEMAARNFVNSVSNNDGVKIEYLTTLKNAVKHLNGNDLIIPTRTLQDLAKRTKAWE